MDPDKASVIDLLKDIEARSLVKDGPVQDEQANTTVWAGLAFQVSGLRLLAPMDEVSEILTLPASLTRVPGAKSWVKGIANIRGNLLPIIDFQAFLGGKPVVANRRSRVLVVNRDEVTTGLLVGNVQGMRLFEQNQGIGSARIDGSIGRFIQAAYENNKGVWPVISLDRLVNDEQFRLAAA